MKAEESREVLHVEEVARMLDISRTSAYEAITRGQLPSIRLGRRLRVPRAALERLLLEGTERTDDASQPSRRRSRKGSEQDNVPRKA